MKLRRAGWIAAGFAVVAGAAGIAAPKDWRVPDAPHRAVVRLEKAPESAESGILIELPETGAAREDLRDLVLVDAAGAPQPLSRVYRAPGQNILLLARSMTPGTDYHLYFGGNRARISPDWQPKVGLMVETRRMAEAEVPRDFAAMEALWRRSEDSDGAGFISGLNLTQNPFGHSNGFVTRITGYLKPPPGRDSAVLHTLSSDASFVAVNGRLALEWPGRHSWKIAPSQLRTAEVEFDGAPVKVEYYHAKGNDGQSAVMFLGWRDGGPVAIPPKQWLHPGSVSLGPIESADGRPFPVPELRARSYFGFEGQWLFEVEYRLREDLPEGWNVTWLFDDGGSSAKPSGRRVFVSHAKQRARVRLVRGAESVEAAATVTFPDGLPNVGVRDRKEIASYAAAMEAEPAENLSRRTLKGYLTLLVQYGSDPQIARFAAPWLAADRRFEDPITAKVFAASFYAAAERDPAGAAAALKAVDGGVRQRFAAEFALLEADLSAFYLKDPGAPQRVGGAAFGFGESDTARWLRIRAGDAYRVLGMVPQATEAYRAAAPGRGDDRKTPAQDQAYSLAVADLLADGFRDETLAKLREWELRHPAAKLETDFLLLRAKVLMRFGRWKQAETELDSFLKIRPETPYEVDVDFLRARIWSKTGRAAEARAAWKALASKYPNHPLAEEARRASGE
jgi:tetratricopeptide (TPR) repeat protein